MQIKKMNKRITAFLLSGCLVISMAACGASGNSSTAASQISSSEASAVVSSESQDPVTPEAPQVKEAFSNFYEYSNADWFASEPLPDNSVYSSRVGGMSDIVFDRLLDFLNNTDPDSYSQDDPLYKIITFYDQIEKNEGAAQANMTALKGVMDRLESPKSIKEFNELMLDEQLFLINPLYNVYYSESTGGESIPTLVPVTLQDIYRYYSDDEKAILTEQYSKCLVLLGYTEEEAKSITANGLQLNGLIRAAYMNGGFGDYIFATEEYFDENPCSVPLLSYFESQGYHYEKTLYSDGKLGFFVGEDYPAWLNDLFVKENLQMIKDFCVLQALDKFAAFGNEELYLTWSHAYLRIFGVAEENLPRTGADYGGLDKKHLSSLLTLDSDNLASYYMNTYVSEDSVQKTDDFLKEIQDTFCEILKEIDWLEPRVRERLAVKAKKLTVENGVYSTYNTLENMTPGENAVETALALLVSKNQYGIANYCDKKDVNTGSIRFADFNAYYLPDTNTMVICDAVYSFDEISANNSFEAWLGSIGSIMAHELSHAYGPTYIEMDSTGLYEELFNEEQYNYYCETLRKMDSNIRTVQSANGSSYLGAGKYMDEAFADLLSMKVCLRILSKLDGPDYDTFFNYFSRCHATQMTDEMYKFYELTDNHLMDDIRVNYVLGQFQEFYDTYDVDPYGGYYFFPDNRVDVFAISE